MSKIYLIQNRGSTILVHRHKDLSTIANINEYALFGYKPNQMDSLVIEVQWNLQGRPPLNKRPVFQNTKSFFKLNHYIWNLV